MKLEVVRTIAKSHRIKPGNLSKTGLIKTIQSGAGNFDCFATACDGECGQVDYLWREDCFASAHLHKGELS